MFLFNTAIDLRYKLYFFSENLKNKVNRLLKSEVKNHSCRETCQSVEVSLVPPKKPKAQLPKDDVHTNFYRFIRHSNRKQMQKFRKVTNMI